jgi:hypothetical protein
VNALEYLAEKLLALPDWLYEYRHGRRRGELVPRLKAGLSSGDGLTRDRVIEKVIANREPDGTWPTQPAVAEALGLEARRIRQVQGDGGWQGILDDAARRISER